MEIRWGIVGCGRISGDFVRAMAHCQSPNRVQAVATSDSSERAKQFCLANGLGPATVRCFGSHAELFADPDVDIVYVGTLNHTHKLTVLGALAGGKHVLCEKPMGVTQKEVREMVEVARQRNLFLMEGYWTRAFPIWRELLEQRVQSVGPVQVVNCDFGAAVNRVNETPGIEHGGEGYLLATGCYGLMAIQAVFGGERPVEVVAKGEKREGGLDVLANILLRYKGGRRAQLFYSSQHHTPGSLLICGPNGNIRIPEMFWSPVEMVVEQYEQQQGPRRAGRSSRHTISHPLPPFDAAHFYYSHTVGLSYEIDHAAECVRQGKTESPLMRLEESVTLAGLLDEVRAQLGVRFPQDCD